MSVNGLTDEELAAFVQQQLARTSLNEVGTTSTTLLLPAAILEDLEDTDPSTTKNNISTYVRHAPHFEGG